MRSAIRYMAAAGLTAAVLAGCGPKPAPVPDATSAPAEAAAGSPPARTINTGAPVDGDATLSAPSTVIAGSEFEADWTGPGNAADYIDIVPRGYTATTGEIEFVYIRDAAARAKLRAPTEPGEYDLRYLAELSTGRVVKTVIPLTVNPANVTFNLPPTSVEAGAPMTIAWTGPGNEGDYIDIVPELYTQTSGEITYAYTRDGNPTKLTAPGAAGDYEIRYLAEGPGGRMVVASAPLTVTAVTATLEAEPVAGRNAMLQVAWTGPSRNGDYIDLVPKGFEETSGELSYAYTRSGSPSDLKTPAKAGDYEIRYVMEAPGGRQILARIPLRVP